jgi:hypothetical protein
MWASKKIKLLGTVGGNTALAAWQVAMHPASCIRANTRWHQILPLLEQYHQIPSERKSETSRNSL